MNIDERKKDGMIHRLTMTGREKMTISGVEDVESFDDDNIILYTVDGTMTVKGAALRINRLDVEDGELEVEGEIDSIEYSDVHQKEKVGLLSRIFK